MNTIGIDLGGTQIRGARVNDNAVSEIISDQINASGSEEDVLQQLFHLTGQLINKEVKAIGIGVPSVVDIEKGIVYDVQNIPSWKEVPLKKRMEERYKIPVLVNNDANCFALGENYFGKGQNYHSFIGLTIGTGLGAGIIINDKLYAGPNCGAGEFGMVNYLDQYYEYYASGQFFKNCHNTSGKTVFQKARNGNEEAVVILKEFGKHLGNAIKMILYTYDPGLILFGGSIREAYAYFQESMWEQINTFAYPKSLEKLSIQISDLENCGVLGAAALYFDEQL